ncbi:MAG: hypothetical protein VYC67_04635 [Pseudomonadota bacterium]|nr:hypothetical protein [Pseudomonadota bacterium]
MLENKAIIHDITINNNDVFDLDIDAENNSLYKLLNRLHVNTRKDVIRSQLLFKVSETYDKRISEETERLLRSNRYIADTDITSNEHENGKVNIIVNTRDAWTLTPGFSYGRGDGKNKSSISIRDYNFLGYGTRIGLRQKSDIDRDSTSFEIGDNNLFSTRYAINANYANNSDGDKTLLDFGKPFYSLNAQSAYGFIYNNKTSIESLYKLGNAESQYQYTSKKYDVFYGSSNGLKENWVKRYFIGGIFEEHEYDNNLNIKPISDDLIPSDRRHVYPFIGLELIEDDFIEEKNIDNIGLVEDRHLGARLSFKLGYADQSMESSSSAWFFDASYSDSFFTNKKQALLFSSSLKGRYEDNNIQDLLFDMMARYDVRLSPKRLFHFGVDTIIGNRLDLNNILYLGGDNKLRGYPARYQIGESKIILTIEQRYYTDWYPFRIARIGGAIFLDIGKTWGQEDLNFPQMGWLKNIGVGLRITNSRSEIGRVLHIDIAYPLDGDSSIDKLQLLIEAKKGF